MARISDDVQSEESLTCRADLSWTSTAGENPEERAYSRASEGAVQLTPTAPDLASASPTAPTRWLRAALFATPYPMRTKAAPLPAQQCRRPGTRASSSSLPLPPRTRARRTPGPWASWQATPAGALRSPSRPPPMRQRAGSSPPQLRYPLPRPGGPGLRHHHHRGHALPALHREERRRGDHPPRRRPQLHHILRQRRRGPGGQCEHNRHR